MSSLLANMDEPWISQARQSLPEREKLGAIYSGGPGMACHFVTA